MDTSKPQAHFRKFSFNNLTKGNWVTLIAVILFTISLFLPWVTRNSYMVSSSFSLTEAISGNISNMSENVKPFSIGYWGLDLIEFFTTGPSFVNITLITLITTVLCFLLTVPFLFSQRAGLRLGLGITQLILSVAGWVPFFFTPSILQFFASYNRTEFPDQPFRRSTFSYGIYLAWLAAFLLFVGAVMVLAEVRKQKRIQTALDGDLDIN